MERLEEIQERWNGFDGSIAVKRDGVADAIMRFSGDAARFVTGTALFVDGGSRRNDGHRTSCRGWTINAASCIELRLSSRRVVAAFSRFRRILYSWTKYNI